MENWQKGAELLRNRHFGPKKQFPCYLQKPVWNGSGRAYRQNDCAHLFCDNCWWGGHGASDLLSPCPHGCFSGSLLEVHRSMSQQHGRPLGVLSYVTLEMLWRAVPEESCCRLSRWEEQCLVGDQKDTRGIISELIPSPYPSPSLILVWPRGAFCESEYKKLPKNVLFGKMNILWDCKRNTAP